MKAVRLLPLFACFAGCNGLFGIDVPPVAELPDGGGQQGAILGGTGAVPEAGAPSNETGGQAPELGGTGGASGDARGGTGGNTNQSGRGGRSSGQGDSGSHNSNTSGAPDDETFPTLGTPCNREGAIACGGRKGRATEVCRSGLWTTGTPCLQDQLCDRTTGACAPPYLSCVNPGDTFCVDAYTRGTCGPDIVTAVLETCDDDYVCDAGSCIPPSATSSIFTVELPPSIDAAGSYWPGTSVPVCFTTPEIQNEWDIVQDEIERTWGRYASLQFTGFDACAPQATGVLVTFRSTNDTCVGELGGIDHIGYAGNGEPVNITLCLKYDRVENSRQEDMLRLVARHEFGHALGFDDVSYAPQSGEFMTREINSNDLANDGFYSQHIALLQQAYGFKPSGAFVDVRGFCLTTSGAAADPSFVNCDGSPGQAFDLKNGQIHSETADTCLRADATTGGVSFGACAADGSAPDPTQAWQPSNVLVRGYGGLCLHDDSGPSLATCESLQPSEFWDLEFVDGSTSFRLHDPGSGNCIGVGEDSFATGNFELKFASCDDCDCDGCADKMECNLEFTPDEQIAIDDWCLAVPSKPDDAGNESSFGPPASGPLEIHPCSLERRMAWSLSARVVGGTSQVLTELTGSYAFSATQTSKDTPTAGIASDTFDLYLRTE
jgi:hypothetical protein